MFFLIAFSIYVSVKGLERVTIALRDINTYLTFCFSNLVQNGFVVHRNATRTITGLYVIGVRYYC